MQCFMAGLNWTTGLPTSKAIITDNKFDTPISWHR